MAQENTMQGDLFASKKVDIIKSYCHTDWWFHHKATGERVKMLFKSGATYSHHKSSDLSIKGESGNCVFMNNEYYLKHFKTSI